MNQRHILAVCLAGVFITALFLQGIRWREFDMIDSGMWGHEAQYVLHNDPREFNFLEAYGHPGGPVIEGVIALHALFGIRNDIAVLVFVTFFNSICITLICWLCFHLRRNIFWCVTVGITLSFSWLYESATPPSAIAPSLIVLLCLLTIYLYEHRSALINTSQKWYRAFWGITAGLAVATRSDIGLFCTASFILTLLFTKSLTVRQAFVLGIQSFVVFCIFDPFMWFMPIQHLKDLVYKIVYHYSDISQVTIPLYTILLMSAVSVLSMGLGIWFVFRNTKEVTPLPRVFICVLLLMTVVLYAIFLSAHSQAERYYMPILFIWEVFLPLFIFYLIDKKPSHSQRALKIIFIIALFIYQVVPFIQSLWIDASYHLLP
jgi:hypothetical protein